MTHVAVAFPCGGGVIVVPLVADHPVIFPTLPGVGQEGTRLPGLLSVTLRRTQLQVDVVLARYGWSGGRRKCHGASKKAVTVTR